MGGCISNSSFKFEPVMYELGQLVDLQTILPRLGKPEHEKIKLKLEKIEGSPKESFVVMSPFQLLFSNGYSATIPSGFVYNCSKGLELINRICSKQNTQMPDIGDFIMRWGLHEWMYFGHEFDLGIKCSQRLSEEIFEILLRFDNELWSGILDKAKKDSDTKTKGLFETTKFSINKNGRFLTEKEVREIVNSFDGEIQMEDSVTHSSRKILPQQIQITTNQNTPKTEDDNNNNYNNINNNNSNNNNNNNSSYPRRLKSADTVSQASVFSSEMDITPASPTPGGGSTKTMDLQSPLSEDYDNKAVNSNNNNSNNNIKNMKNNTALKERRSNRNIGFDTNNSNTDSANNSQLASSTIVSESIVSQDIPLIVEDISNSTHFDE